MQLVAWCGPERSTDTDGDEMIMGERAWMDVMRWIMDGVYVRQKLKKLLRD